MEGCLFLWTLQEISLSMYRVLNKVDDTRVGEVDATLKNKFSWSRMDRWVEIRDSDRNILKEDQLGQTDRKSDGRNDSPGHSAKYCSYTLMEDITKKILTLKTLDKRKTERKSAAMKKMGFIFALEEVQENSPSEVDSTKKILTLKTLDKRKTERKSAAMEKSGFIFACEKVQENGLKASEVVTDAHLGITSYMSMASTSTASELTADQTANVIGRVTNATQQQSNLGVGAGPSGTGRVSLKRKRSQDSSRTKTVTFSQTFMQSIKTNGLGSGGSTYTNEQWAAMLYI
ncbi:hypothetical protein ACF0H5_022707 [Mactra antiquata]